MIRDAWLPGLVALVLLAVAPPARAQTWSLDAYWGRATYDQVATNVQAENPVAALRFVGAGREWLYITAAPAMTGDGAPWAAAGAGHAPAYVHRNWVVGLELEGHGYIYRDAAAAVGASGGTLAAVPFVRLSLPRAQVDLRSGWLQHVASFGGVRGSRGVSESALRLRVGRPELSAGVEGRYVRAEEGGYPFVGASAAASFGGVSLWGSGGTWMSDDLPAPSWGAGGALDVTSAIRLFAGVRRDGSSPLYWNTARSTLSIGLSWILSRGKAPVTEAPVLLESDGRVLLRLPAHSSERAPSVAADFTGWRPVTMRRQGRYWVAEFRPDRGVYEYSFRDADGVWFVPERVPGRRADGMGGWVAVLVVP